MQQVSSLNGNTQFYSYSYIYFICFCCNSHCALLIKFACCQKPQLVLDFHSIFSETQPSSELQVGFKCSSTYQLKEFYFSYRFNIHLYFFCAFNIHLQHS